MLSRRSTIKGFIAMLFGVVTAKRAVATPTLLSSTPAGTSAVSSTVSAPVSESASTLESKAIAAIDDLCNSDWCEDAEMALAFHKEEKLTERDRHIYEIVSKVYRIAHGCNKENSCYHVHGDWRKEAVEAYEHREK
jgi:hypothetical protein